jgi:4-diphosphocytidyl-2-C-methyl-D-erythritol kinase
MISFPPCKINLGLNIIAKRADGYHDVETCFYPVPWTDILEVIEANHFSFSSSGTPIPGDGDQNLCVKAYWLLQKDFDLSPVAIHLHKVIPTGAGLGGGSSDAAHTLTCINKLFNLGLSANRLKSYAAKLGSDCSFFIEPKPMLGQSRGELLSPLDVDLKGYYLILVNPQLHVSTAEAYAGVLPQVPLQRIEKILKSKPIAQWKNFLQNDFEESVFRKYPLIKEIKESLYELDALYVAMSGSGSTVFALFNYQVDLRKWFSGMTYWAGSL